MHLDAAGQKQLAANFLIGANVDAVLERGEASCSGDVLLEFERGAYLRPDSG